MNPIVSIIVPCYNVEAFIDECLTSLTNQTLREIEIICIDDASIDNTLAKLNEWRERDPRIVVIHQDKNQRQGAARNKGIAVAKGEYIGFVDADDWIESDMYSVMMNKASKQDADVVCCDVIWNYPASTDNHAELDMSKTKNEIVKKFTREELAEITDQIDITDTNTIIMFGKSAADEISKCSDSVLNMVEMDQINRTGAMLTTLTKIMTSFDMGELVDHKDENTFYKFIMMPYINYLSHVEKIKSGLISGEELEECKDMWKTIREWYMSRQDDIETKCDIENRLKQMNIKR